MAVVTASLAIVVAPLCVQSAGMRSYSYRYRRGRNDDERNNELHLGAPCQGFIARNFCARPARVVWSPARKGFVETIDCHLKRSFKAHQRHGR